MPWKPKGPIGSITFFHIVRGAFLSCFLGYRLNRGDAGRGFMGEAPYRAVRYIFDEAGFHWIEANSMPENGASSPEYLKICGVWEDHMHYVLLNHRLVSE